jgi:predicted acetyltransferase
MKADREIGAARPEELDAMLRLMCEAFAVPFAPAREAFYADPCFDIENKRVLRANGRVVSCLTIVEARCWLGAGVARLGGIAGVATLPSQRRRGYAGRLLTETVRELDARGYALSALFPYAYDYYRRFGWELAGVEHRCLIAPQRLPAFPEARRVRLFRPEDRPSLERLYDDAARGRTLHCLRDGKRWSYLLSGIKHRVVYAPGARTVEGYLLYEHRRRGEEGAGSIAPGVTFPPILRVLEMRAATPAARRGLLGYLAAQSYAGSIEYAAAPEDLLEMGLLDAIHAGSGGETLANVEIVPAVMARVVRLARVAESLRPNWSGFRGTLALTCQDLLPELDSCGVVRGNGIDAPEIEATFGSDALPDRIEGDARAWAPVVVGHLSGDDACALGLLNASTPRAREMAAQLFPRRAPFLPAPDHF